MWPWRTQNGMTNTVQMNVQLDIMRMYLRLGQPKSSWLIKEPLRQYQNKEIYDRVLPNIGYIISKLGIIRDFPVRVGAQSPTISTNDKEKSSILIKIAWLRSGGRAVSSHLQDCEHRDIVTLWALWMQGFDDSYRFHEEISDCVLIDRRRWLHNFQAGNNVRLFNQRGMPKKFHFDHCQAEDCSIRPSSAAFEH